MNKRIRELAEQAGFVLWSDCDWKPEGEVIDWASSYDKELEQFAELVRADERDPWVKTYCGGKPNYTTPPDDDIYDIWVEQKPVQASDMSQERVDETAKDRHEFEEMVKKGTKAWADTPDDWVDDLRGGVEKIVPSTTDELIKCLEKIPKDEVWVHRHNNHLSTQHYVGSLCHEAATLLRELTTQQKPVGEIVKAFEGLTAVSIPVMPPIGTKLYTAPREWVGLTDEEVAHIADSEWEEAFVRLIEAKLKEKNGG